jgi:hypothetical protein
MERCRHTIATINSGNKLAADLNQVQVEKDAIFAMVLIIVQDVDGVVQTIIHQAEVLMELLVAEDVVGVNGAQAEWLRYHIVKNIMDLTNK